MPSFFVITATGLPPVISVTMTGITYQQFKESLGYYVYYVDKIYLYSNNPQQIKGSFYYLKYDSNGNSTSQSVVSAISPYQYESAIYLQVANKKLVIDGRDYVQFTMQPNTTLSIKLYAEQLSVGTEYDDQKFNAFYDYDRNEDTNFFDDYNEFI